VDKWKNHNPNRTKKKHRHDKNKSEYNQLRNFINRQAKKDKEEWLGQYCEEIENELNWGNIEKSYNLIRKFFGKPKIKHTIIESKEGKTLIEDEEIADRWQQYIKVIRWFRRTWRTGKRRGDYPKELGPTITKA